eukprot:Nk52_evm1s502 gene=Nk52_evmTU1s502
MSQELHSVVGFGQGGNDPDPYGFGNSQTFRSPPSSQPDNLQFFNNSGGAQQGQASSSYGFGGDVQGNIGSGGGSGGTANEYSFEDEPPLLEELGINFDQIKNRTWSVLHPLTTPNSNLMEDCDLAAPFLFAIAFGGFSLLSGKVHFNYVYGVGLVGCMAIWAILNFMNERGINLTVCVSILGYCLLPVVILSSVAVLLNLKGILGLIIVLFFISWSTYSSSKIFVTCLGMRDQQFLVAYPCLLLYGMFALLAVF